MAEDLWGIRERLSSTFRLARLAVLCAVLGCAAGPADSPADSTEGGAYEERLKATAKKFAHFELLDENLKKERWKKLGISFRVPRPFEFVEAPDRNLAEGHALSREILGELLPGVVGVWQAVLPGKEGARPETAYLFLLSNYHLLSRSYNSAIKFHQTLVEVALVDLKGLDHLPIESNWQTENWLGHGLPYTWASFPATLAKTGKPADFTLFLAQYGTNDRHDEIKVALVFVIPKAAEFQGSRPDADPLKLSAQTLLITLP